MARGYNVGQLVEVGNPVNVYVTGPRGGLKKVGGLITSLPNAAYNGVVTYATLAVGARVSVRVAGTVYPAVAVPFNSQGYIGLAYKVIA